MNEIPLLVTSATLLSPSGHGACAAGDAENIGKLGSSRVPGKLAARSWSRKRSSPPTSAGNSCPHQDAASNRTRST